MYNKIYMYNRIYMYTMRCSVHRLFTGENVLNSSFFTKYIIYMVAYDDYTPPLVSFFPLKTSFKDSTYVLN